MDKNTRTNDEKKAEVEDYVSGCCLVPVLAFIVALVIANNFGLAFFIALIIGISSIFPTRPKLVISDKIVGENNYNIENEVDYTRVWATKHPLVYKIINYILKITEYNNYMKDKEQMSELAFAHEWVIAHPTAYKIVGYLLRKTNYNYNGVSVTIRNKDDLVESWFESHKSVNKLYQLHPTDFEIFIAELYKRLGYKTERTKTSGDEGIDVFAEKDGKKYVIQVKRSSSPVGSPVIQKLYGSMAHVLADYGICVSLAGYSTQAHKFAENKKIELLDGDDIVSLMRMASKQTEQ